MEQIAAAANKELDRTQKGNDHSLTHVMTLFRIHLIAFALMPYKKEIAMSMVT